MTAMHCNALHCASYGYSTYMHINNDTVRRRRRRRRRGK
jgi:hypothetical protein